MNKILSLVLLAMTAFAQAQAQIKVIKEDGTAVQEGETLVFDSPVDDPMGAEGVKVINTRYPVIVPEDPEATVPFDAQIVSLTYERTDGASSTAWCLGGSCIPVTDNPSTRQRSGLEAAYMRDPNGNLLVGANGQHAPSITNFMQLDTEFEEGKYDRITAEVEITSQGRHIVTFHYNFIYPDPTGITDASAGGDRLQFDHATATYSFTQAAPRLLRIYSTDGRLAQNASLTGTNGTVSLSSLPTGVYLYSLLLNGKQVLSGKTLLP